MSWWTSTPYCALAADCSDFRAVGISQDLTADALRLDVDDTLYPVSSGFSDHRNGEARMVKQNRMCL